MGNAPWEGHAPQAADSGWNGQPAAAVNVDSFEQVQLLLRRHSWLTPSTRSLHIALTRPWSLKIGGPPPLSMSLVPQEAPQPANSVLGTLVNEDAVSDMDNDNDNDVKSLQPSLSQGSLGRPRAAAPGEPSHHGSVLQTASATSAPPHGARHNPDNPIPGFCYLRNAMMLIYFELQSLKQHALATHRCQPASFFHFLSTTDRDST